jgi:hypothetical protein
MIYSKHEIPAPACRRADGDCTRSPPQGPASGVPLDFSIIRRRGIPMNVSRGNGFAAMVPTLLLLGTTPTAAAELSAEAPTVFITGSNRGLGLEFARQYAALGWNVIATCRNPDAADELQGLSADYPRVIIDRLDVTEQMRSTPLPKNLRNSR